NGKFSCPLVLMNHSYSCVCKVTRDKLSAVSVYDIDLCNTFDCHRLVESFKPSKNVQMTPPHKAEVHQTPEAFNITWKSGYEKHDYLASFVRYQLLLQTFQSSESKTSHLESDEKFVSILRLHPKAYAKYCIKVRSEPIRYTGTWSKWSPLTCWENEAQKEQETILVILTKSLAPVCVVVGVFLFVFYSPATRERIKTLSRTPSPAPFFQPLFQQHKGNLQ
uniref:interleukin-4 receptor subunit alpha-like n=1 Tax=Monopterus albus TaxID=43700 RepID=UPI0009B46F37